MKRIDSANARPDINGAGKKGFHNNLDLPGVDATYITPDWLNAIQEELCNLLEKNNIALNPASKQQLFDLLATYDDVEALATAVQAKLDVHTGQINALNSQIAAEELARQIADNLLNNKIDAILNAPSLLATNGYTTLPTGVIQQWGTVDFDSNPPESAHTINFTIAFPNACLNVQATRKIQTGNTSEGDGGILFESATATTATFSLQKYSDTSDEKLRGFTWFATGY